MLRIIVEVKRMTIKLSQPDIDQTDINAVNEVMKSGWLVQGPKVKQFEDDLAKYIGAKNVIVCNGATQAIHMTLAAMRKVIPREKTEIITPDYSYPSVAVSIKQAGFKPRFCDINPDTYTADIDDIEQRIRPYTAAVMTHVPYGYPNDYDKLRDLCDDYKLNFFDDGAPGMGAKYKGKKVGSFTETFFSFHPTKIITTGEGGAVTTDNDTLADQLRMLRNQGRVGMVFQELGYHYRMTDMQGALGISQLKKLDTSIAYRRKLALLYINSLDEGIDTMPFDAPDFFWTVQRFVVSTRFPAQKIIEQLAKAGIESSIGTYSQSKQQLFKQPTPTHADHAYYHAFCLPMHTKLSIDDVQFISRTLNNIVHSM
jgi:perosamine synthetase